MCTTGTSTPSRVLARQSGSGESLGGSTGGGGGEGSDSDAIYAGVLQRLREEKEQLGQMIDHPF